MIGIFDSGFGGLTIFKDIENRLPNYDYIYLGDNARAPYGQLSQQIIYNYTKQAVDWLFGQGCQLIILACNTTSAEALRQIQQEHLPSRWPGRNVLGVIRPLAEAAILTGSKKVAVIGTESTIESGSYNRELKHQNPNIEIIQQACPLLVRLIEAGQEKEESSREILGCYLEPIKKANPDVLILGCTHYGWLADDIVEFLGPRVKILDSGQIIAAKLADYLDRHPEFKQLFIDPGRRVFLTTDNSVKFDQAATRWLGRQISSKTIKLG